MDTTHNKDVGGKIWNNQQKKGDLNEGFSGENIPDDYNPGKHVSEKETDSSGNTKYVDRARNADVTSDDERNRDEDESLSHASDIYEEKQDGKEDFNYDAPGRQQNANKQNRGNMELDE